MSQMLIIEQNEDLREELRTFFEAKDYEVILAETGASGLSLAIKRAPDIILIDLQLPDIYGLTILKEIKNKNPYTIIYTMTNAGEIKEAIEAIKQGAEHYFLKPIDFAELEFLVEKSSDIIHLREELSLFKKSPYPMVGRSKAVQSLVHLINLMAENSNTTLLIQGETGTGKELLARNIHALSRRANFPFMDINCASIPDNILEGELFGYEPGAFTDAKIMKKGLIEIADKGTLFLDEIGDMPMNTQAKILRVLETRTLRRLGGTKDIKVDIRIIAASNKDLEASVRNNTFRDDLYYRLNVMPVTIPPLRERPEDIPLLAELFLSDLRSSTGKKIFSFDKRAMDIMMTYNWPGNIRELKNIIERATILATSKNITADNIVIKSSSTAHAPKGQSIDDVVEAHIKKILEGVDGNKSKASKILGCARSTLIEKLKDYGID